MPLIAEVKGQAFDRPRFRSNEGFQDVLVEVFLSQDQATVAGACPQGVEKLVDTGCLSSGRKGLRNKQE